MVSPQPNQIADWEEALQQIGNDGDALTGDLTAAQFYWRPAPDKWSVGECFDHLAIATGLMLSRVRPVIDRGRALDQLRVASAARGGSWLKFNLAAWFAGTIAHLRRHLAQARRVTETAGFPGS